MGRRVPRRAALTALPWPHPKAMLPFRDLGLIMKRFVALVLLSTALATSAHAQAPAPIDVTWRAFTTPNGCIFHEGDLLNMVPDAPKATATRSSACKAGEAIIGEGTITLKRLVNGFATTRTCKGQLSGGYLDGRITIADSYVSIDNPADKETGTPHTFPCRMGCMVLTGTDGDLESGTIGNQPIQCVA